MRHSDFKNLLRRKVDQFRLGQEASEFLFTQREIERGFRKFLPLQPRGIIVERICGLAVGLMKGDAKLFVLEVADSGNKIFFQEICGTSRDLDGELNVRFWKNVVEVCPSGDEDIWDLRFDRS